MQIYKPSFWKDKNLFSFIFYPISLITNFYNFLKNLNNKKKFNIKVICVGNIYIGGTGKTPLAIKIKKILNSKFRIAFIKKKYSNQIDEQNLLKKNGYLICSEKRSRGIKKAIDQKYELAILDDGLQEKTIYHDISIACFNSVSKIGNNLVLPAGPLREKLSNLKFYDAAFINGEKSNNKLIRTIKNYNKNIKIFEGKYKITNKKNLNKNLKYLVFSGIGTPEEFENTLIKYKFKIYKHIKFPDHYDYSHSDIKKIKVLAKEKKLKVLTTEKDFLRLKKDYTKNINYIKVELEIKNLKDFKNFLNHKL